MSTVLAEPVLQQPRVTPQDLLERDDAVRFELVNGRLVERNVSTESSVVAVRISRLLDVYVDANQLGVVAGSDCSFQCFYDVLLDRDRIRKPDVSFIAAGRLTEEQYRAGHTPIAPDLAVEVVSPNDNDAELDEKIEDYLAAGVHLIWVVRPRTKTVTTYHQDGSSQRLRATDKLSGEGVVPGFECLVADLFPTIRADAKAAL